MAERYNQNKRRVEETKRKRREEKRLRKQHKSGPAPAEAVIDPPVAQPPAEGNVA
jgi:hypothetical protein